MSTHFDNFINVNEHRISQVAEVLQYFEINAQKIRIINAKKRVIAWLQNFDNLEYNNLELPLHLLERIDFIKSDELSDKVIALANKLIKSSYIAPLGETKESSFKITAKLHRESGFYTSFSQLLNSIPDSSQTRILLFDDFLNSGGQLVSIFYALLNRPIPGGEINEESDSRTKLSNEQIKKLKNSEIHLFYYQVFDEGIKKVEKRLKSELRLNINVHSHFYTNNNHSAFGDANEQENIKEGISGRMKHQSIFQGKNYAELRDFYLILRNVGIALLKVKEPDWNESKVLSRMLGYGNLCRVIIVDSNVPTVTLTALWQNGNISINGRSIEWKELVPRIKKVLPKTKPKPTIRKTEVDYDAIVQELQVMYETGQINKGIERSDMLVGECGTHPKILKRILRFHMRVRNWGMVRAIIKELQLNSLPDDLVTVCQLALYECEMRESYLLYKEDKTELRKKLQNSRKYLNEVPKSCQNHEEYLYKLGRWYLQLWWITKEFSTLSHAVLCFERAIKLHYRWWIHCYKCIVLKLMKNSEFETETVKYKKAIFEMLEIRPKQPSVRIHCISAFVLQDDLQGLESFLKEISDPTAPTDFQATAFYHVELIYHDDKERQAKYRSVLENWMAALPRK